MVRITQRNIIIREPYHLRDVQPVEVGAEEPDEAAYRLQALRVSSTHR